MMTSWKWRALVLVVGFASITAGCAGDDGRAGSTEERGAAESERTAGGEARVESGPSDTAELDPDQLPLRVYTSLIMSPHFSRSSGRWYRRAESGAWEQATCSRSVIFDPGVESAPPTCGRWSAVPAADIATVERIAGERREVTCADQPELCAALGLRADQTESQ